MDTCPLTGQKCEDESGCPFLVKLEDYEGCPFDLAGKAIHHLKVNVILPAAIRLDELVGRFLKIKK